MKKIHSTPFQGTAVTRDSAGPACADRASVQTDLHHILSFPPRLDVNHTLGKVTSLGTAGTQPIAVHFFAALAIKTNMT